MIINYDQCATILGQVGETIVSNYLISEGFKVYKSTDYFDSQKDFLLDGKKIEIKTKQPYVLKNAFSFEPNQLRKCLNVDDLYFVSVPPLFKKDYKYGGYIFRINPKEMRHFTYTTKGGTRMVAVPIEQPAMSRCAKIADRDVEQLIKYAQSDYQR